MDSAVSFANSTLAMFSKLSEELLGLNTPRARREALKAKAKGLILHDRAIFSGTQRLDFQIRNIDLIMQGRWSWIRWPVVCKRQSFVVGSDVHDLISEQACSGIYLNRGDV